MHVFDNLKQYDKRYQNRVPTSISNEVKEEQLTPAEVELLNKRVKTEQRKEKWHNILNGLGVLSFFVFLIGVVIAIYNSNELQYIIAGVVGIVVLGIIFLCAYFLFEDKERKTHINVIRAILIGIAIIALIIIIGSVIPDGFINDAHRPDKF